jgi:methanogenic corrinoid protein MtbC1
VSVPPSLRLDELIVRMDERGALAQIHERLDAGEDAAVLVEECRTGMERVGRLYEEGTYFISALIMAGEIIREATELLIPRLTAVRQETGGGRMVIATVRGDIHDIGKNIVIALLDADGFTMVDLGVNVAPEVIAETVERERPDVLGLSCLLTSGYEALRETIDLVRKQSAASTRRAPTSSRRSSWPARSSARPPNCSSRASRRRGRRPAPAGWSSPPCAATSTTSARTS